MKERKKEREKKDSWIFVRQTLTDFGYFFSLFSLFEYIYTLEEKKTSVEVTRK